MFLGIVLEIHQIINWRQACWEQADTLQQQEEEEAATDQEHLGATKIIKLHQEQGNATPVALLYSPRPEF